MNEHTSDGLPSATDSRSMIRALQERGIIMGWAVEDVNAKETSIEVHNDCS